MQYKLNTMNETIRQAETISKHLTLLIQLIDSRYWVDDFDRYCETRNKLAKHSAQLGHLNNLLNQLSNNEAIREQTTNNG